MIAHTAAPDGRAETAEPLLSVSDLRVSFTQHGRTVTEAVRGVSFELGSDETLCVVGESGSGKSVTAKSLLRLLPPESTRYAGQMRYEGRDLLQMSDRELRGYAGGRIGMIFQDPLSSLNPVYTIRQQMTDVIRLHDPSVTETQARTTARQLLEDVEIRQAEAVLGNYPYELSGGMRQRVMIAMALSAKPALLVADEPTTALDVTVQAQILQLLQKIQAEHGLSIMFITHDLAIAHELADRIVVFNHGQIVEQGTVDDIFFAPQHAYTKTLLNSMLRI